MHEKLNEQIDAMDEKVIKIANLYLDRIETALESGGRSNNTGNELINVKSAGEALKALADGLESYRAVTNAIKKDATPVESWEPPTEPVVGGQGYTGTY